MTNARLFILLFLSQSVLSSHAQRADRMHPTIFETTEPFVHDPVMAFEDSLYYAYYTSRNIGMMTSRDRQTWTVRRDGMLTDIPAWTRDSVPGFKSHIWAPDIMRWHGRWWMAYSCSTFGKNTSAIGLLSASSLAKNDWRDEGCLVASQEKRDNWNAIDANFIIDDHDQPWLTWGSFWDGIQLAPLKTVETDGHNTLRLDGWPRTIARRYYKNAPQGLRNPTSEYAGANAIEAPFLFKHNGWYYLFVSWDYCCRGEKSTYRVAVGRSQAVSGPYLDRDGRPMYAGGGTLVIEGDKKMFEAAGHSAAYHFADGDLFICHGYSIPHHGLSVLIQKRIRWDNGWPVLEQ